MIPILALVIGAVLGFVGSRQLRRTSGSDATPRLQQPRPSRPARPRSQPPSVPRPLAASPRSTVDRPAPATTLALVRRDTRARTALGTGPLSIGRSVERDLTIDDDRVSRSHAYLERRGDGWYVIDDGSANGTTVNRSKITAGEPRQVHAGDRIGIGPFDLDVVAGDTVESDDRTKVFGS